MKTLKKLRAFCEGYRAGVLADKEDIAGTDDWLIWGGYDINIVGAEHFADVCSQDLAVIAYPEGWAGNLPEPLHKFIV